MFTSEPSLAQRIERMIGDVPIVDTRSLLPAEHWQAPDLAALLTAPPLRPALGGVGMTYELLHPDRTVAERVELALPFLRQIRNTTAAWCLFRIFRDLYDFDEPHLTLANYPALLDRVARSAADPAWGRTVIRDRAKVRVTVAPLPRGQAVAATETEKETPTAPPLDLVVHRLDIDATDPGDATPDQIRSRVYAQLDEEIEGTVRFAGFAAIPDLDNPVHRAVLEWHQIHQAPVQVVLDQFRPAAGQVAAITAIATQFHEARFGLLTGSPQLGAEVATLAGYIPNLFAGDDSGWGAGAAALEANILARVQQAGMAKIGGFASGATTAEWVYGSLLATRKATASALAQAVAGGFFEEDEIPPLLRAIFAESPATWYRLDD